MLVASVLNCTNTNTVGFCESINIAHAAVMPATNSSAWQAGTVVACWLHSSHAAARVEHEGFLLYAVNSAIQYSGLSQKLLAYAITGKLHF